MTVISVEKDPQTLTMTLTARFDAPVEDVWEVWSDPRKLERWWGPPGWPATVTEHNLASGGNVAYFMTGPAGERAHGWWRLTSVESPRRIEFDGGFAHEDGRRNDEMPTMTMRIDLAPVGGGTTMTIATAFPSIEAMEQLVGMGMEEGIKLAAGQIDALLR
jgi:uncharacterized protein YndB with AHSA1/START domain